MELSPEGIRILESTEALQQMGISNVNIAKYLSVGRTTLYKYKKFLPEEISLNDDELMLKIMKLKRDCPHFGEVYLKGALLAEGYRITRKRIRDCVNLIDPHGAVERRRPKIPRGIYSVPGPMYSWCFDGNEKLQWVKIYLHGCVDAASRKVMYLGCASSKKAGVPLKFFYDAACEYGLPHSVRCDKGGENVQINEFMNVNLGIHHRCVIRGRSTANVRIERLWREINKMTRPFKNLFCRMERHGMLDPGNDIHLLALHHVYIPRIQASLDGFVRVWDAHKIRTAEYKTPNEMFFTGDRAPEYDISYFPVHLLNEPDLLQDIWDFASSIIPDPLLDDGNDGVVLFLSLRDALTSEFLAAGFTFN